MFQYEAKARLESMSGSTSISSADLFGDGSSRSTGERHCFMEYCLQLKDRPRVLILIELCLCVL